MQIGITNTDDGEASLSLPANARAATKDNINQMKDVPILFRAFLRLLLNIQRGHLSITLPNGKTLSYRGSHPGVSGVMTIHNYKFASQLFSKGNLGLGESYMDKFWDSPDVTSLLELVSSNMDHFRQHVSGKSFASRVARIVHYMRGNTKSQAQRNIQAHYDLGNQFYETWLDPSMTYSSGIFQSPNEPLEQAQHNKYEALARRIDLRPEHHVLEIGCGWGGFAEYAAEEIGCRVTGITISKAQLEFARRRMNAKGLSDRVDIQYRDYRDMDGQYDRIASIEMFEAVGEAYWPRYFQAVRDLLKKGGKAGLQIITIRDKDYPIYRRSVDFIQRYIFPGGMLPSPNVFAEQVKASGLKLTDNDTFRLSYAKTLHIWHQKFLKEWPQISTLGFDDRFKRMWTLYYAYCEAGFRTGSIDVAQVRLEHD
jgi:cyclopropane-fatty-acyl-phospholipid synthase